MRSSPVRNSNVTAGPREENAPNTIRFCPSIVYDERMPLMRSSRLNIGAMALPARRGA
jgi:hypothetical protein